MLRMKNETSLTFCGSSQVIYAGRWGRMALLLKKVAAPCSRPVIPNLGFVYPQGYICLSEGVHLRLSIGDNIYLHIICFQIFIHHVDWHYFQKSLYAYCWIYLWIIMIKYFVVRNFRGTCSSVEKLKGVHAYLLKCCRVTFLSVGVLKGYIVRESLGTPVLEQWFSMWSMWMDHQKGVP